MGRLFKEADTLKMTYFNNLNHEYNRVIFEFTNEEKKDAGFHRTNKEPSVLEMIRLVQRIAEDRTIKGDYVPPEVVAKAKREVAKLQADMINSWPNEDGTPTPEDKKSKEAYLSEMEETMKQFSREDHADLQRKKDAWKAKALRLIGFLNDKDKVIRRLLRENKLYRNNMSDRGL